MAEQFKLTEKELKGYVDAAGEEPHIDHKAPIEWDGAVRSAGLAKDIIACANVRGGGVIVIGVSEPEPGRFVREGISGEQARTFDTTAVAGWVNARCEPPIQLTCYRVSHHDATFEVIRIAEFEDVPVICTKEFVDPSNPKKRLLVKGAIYVRRPGAESAPLQSADDLRPLVGLAATKKQDEMLTAIRSVIEGTPLVPAAEAADPYAEEENEIMQVIDATFKSVGRGGAWLLRCYPADYEAKRWPSTDKVSTFLNQAVRAMRWTQFSVPVRGLNHGGIITLDDRVLALAYSGLAVLKQAFGLEDERDYRDPSITPREHFSAGQWIDFKWVPHRVRSFFRFTVAWAQEFDPATQLVYEISANELAGRTIVSEDPRVSMGLIPPPCVAPSFRRRGQVSAAELIAGWQDHCADVLYEFMRLFHESITRDVILTWIQK